LLGFAGLGTRLGSWAHALEASGGVEEPREGGAGCKRRPGWGWPPPRCRGGFVYIELVFLS
jgi:hypothetical protein